MAPGVSVHPGLPVVPEQDLHRSEELAYTGPSYGPRDTREVQRLLGMIDEMVGEEPTSSPPAYLKVTKMTLPKPYAGKDDLDAFEIWFHNLLEFFRTLRITGPSMDRDRLRILGDCLADDAATWLYNTVQSPSRERREWLFEEAIVGLFRRFIHRDNHLQASQEYENLRFEPNKGGVAALYERLLYITEKMWEKPSPFQIRCKFIETLPVSYENTLTVLNGLSVKYNSLSQLYQAALEIEQSSRAIQQRRRIRDTTPGTNNPSSSNDHRTTRSNNTQPRRPPAAEPLPRTSSSTVRRQGPSRTAPGRTDRPRPTPGQVSRPAPKPAATKAASQCFSCGQIGHFASDPACPNHGKKTTPGQRMFAQRVVDDTSDNEQPDAPLETQTVEFDLADDAGTPGDTQGLDPEAETVQDLPQSEFEFVGSQYESADEQAQSEWEDFEHDDAVYMASMRVEAIASEGSANEPRIHSMAIANERGLRHAWIYDAKVRKIEDPAAQPQRVHEAQRTLCAEIPINGIKALVLFDSGCTTDSITPEFAYLCKAGRIDLQEPVGLQLGTKGSRTKINFGAQAEIALNSVRDTHYFDVVDIDKYDAIFGTVFCRKYGIVLDFANDRVLVGKQSISLFKEEAISSKTPKRSFKEPIKWVTENGPLVQ
ncbi:hypothetical protein VTO73DRAFT_6440 [Trametes versicolor]